MPSASLLAIGNELLNGAVQDTNLFTLSRQLTHLGIQVGCAAIARDTPAHITQVLRFLLADTPDVLICSGGLGPTADDLTLSALAQALERPLVFNAQAYEYIEAHYQRLLSQHHLTHHGPPAARRKMATLPQRAKPLPNPVGTAPGVTLQHGPTYIYVLPGVPAELEAIFVETIVPALQQRFDLGAWVERALRIHCDDEAEVAPLLQQVSEQYPSIYLKSLARPFPAAAQQGLRVIAALQAPDAAQAERAVEQALTDLRHVAEAAGFRVTR